MERFWKFYHLFEDFFNWTFLGFMQQEVLENGSQKINYTLYSYNMFLFPTCIFYSKAIKRYFLECTSLCT